MRLDHANHIILIHIRNQTDFGLALLLYPQTKWRAPDGESCLALPSKTTVEDEPEPFVHGTSLEAFVDAAMRDRLGLSDTAYVLEDEIQNAEAMPQPSPKRTTSPLPRSSSTTAAITAATKNSPTPNAPSSEEN